MSIISFKCSIPDNCRIIRRNKVVGVCGMTMQIVPCGTCIISACFEGHVKHSCCIHICSSCCNRFYIISISGIWIDEESRNIRSVAHTTFYGCLSLINTTDHQVIGYINESRRQLNLCNCVLCVFCIRNPSYTAASSVMDISVVITCLVLDNCITVITLEIE